MIPDTSLDDQRHALRAHLQSHRRILISRFNPPAPADKDAFPRSMLMRMLSGKSTMLLLFMAEALPLLLVRYIGKSSLRADK